MQDNPTSSTPKQAVKATRSDLSGAITPKTPGKPKATGPQDVSNVQSEPMTRDTAPERVGDTAPPPQPTVREMLTEMESTIVQVRAAKPVDEARYDAFQGKRTTALDLEFKACLITRQVELLKDADQHTSAALALEHLPPNVAALINQSVSELSPGGLKAALEELEKTQKKAWKDTAEAWDTALVDYLAAHQLDRKELEHGFKNTGFAYAARVILPAGIGAATSFTSFIHPKTPKLRLANTGGGAFATVTLGGIVQPTVYGATTLTSVTVGDQLLNGAADIQNLLGTKMIEEVDKDLGTALSEAGAALHEWHSVKDGKDSAAKTAALKKMEDAAEKTKKANGEFLMRADLNRVYLQGFQNQGILNGLKYYGNLAVGPLSAALGSTLGGATQLGIAAVHLGLHLAVSPDDEKNKQLRMFYLRMRASEPVEGEDRAETLKKFDGEKRDKFKVRGQALAQIFTKDVGKLDTKIMDMLKLKSHDWKTILKLAAFEASGGEEGAEFKGNLEDARALKDRVTAQINALPEQKRAEVLEMVTKRHDTANDILHLGDCRLSQISESNAERVLRDFHFTKPSESVLGMLKNALMLPFSTEFRVGMEQGLARMQLPQEVMTTYGLAYWAAYQLGICGENGPLILSKLSSLVMAGVAYGKDKESPSDKANIILQSTLAGIGLAATGYLIHASSNLLSIVLADKTLREKVGPAAGGRSAEANTTYLASLLRDREPHRAERNSEAENAGLQRTGYLAGFGKDLWPTLVSRLTVLAKESIPAGHAKEKFLMSIETLVLLRDEIEKADPESAKRIDKNISDFTKNAEEIHEAIKDAAGPSEQRGIPEPELPEEDVDAITVMR